MWCDKTKIEFDVSSELEEGDHQKEVSEGIDGAQNKMGNKKLDVSVKGKTESN
jgi:hypothetical protein